MEFDEGSSDEELFVMEGTWPLSRDEHRRPSRGGAANPQSREMDREWMDEKVRVFTRQFALRAFASENTCRTKTVTPVHLHRA